MADLYGRLIYGALRAYKLTLSPWIGRQCRFMPSCSEYAAIGRHRHKRLNANKDPPIGPCSTRTWAAYSEQLGMNRHWRPIQGDRVSL